MSDSLTVEIHSELVPVKDAEWRRLFPASPDPVEWVRLIEKSGFDEFVFHSLVIRQNNDPILVLPLFETKCPLTKFCDGAVKKALERLCPNRLKIHVLGVGIAGGEWGELGIDTTVDSAVLQEAWTMAMESLDSLAVGLNASLLAWINFTSAGAKRIPIDIMHKYTAMSGVPRQLVAIRHDNLERDLDSLSKARRENELRAGTAVTILRTVDPEPWLDAIQTLYLRTFHSAEFASGKNRSFFFEHATKLVPGAEYVLYLLDGKLVAFNLVIRREQMLVNKCFCMEPDTGRKHDLRLLSWMENIRYCMEQKIPLYHAGSGDEEVKARFKTDAIPTKILFKHRNPLIQKILSPAGRRGF